MSRCREAALKGSLMSEDALLLLGFVFFLVVVYATAFGVSLARGRTVGPYVVLLACHGLATLWLVGALATRTGGGDAAGNAMSTGYTWLFWAMANLALAGVALLVLVFRPVVSK